VQGRKGDQAIQLSLLDPTPSVSKALRKKPEDMVNIVEDTMKLMENLERTYRRGRHPEPRAAKQTAQLLRALAAELEL
jgi:CspA family cold shock protein